MVEVRLTHPQRRTASRRAVDLTCEAVRDRGFVLAGRRILDLSSEGAFLVTHLPLELGEEVLLAFRAPHTRFWIDARGVVVRKAAGRRRSDRARGVGLRFLPLDEADQAVLAATLRKVPPTLPRRAPTIDYAAAVREIGQG
jgi:Tfp pilus assembly protein PilZ